MERHVLNPIAILEFLQRNRGSGIRRLSHQAPFLAAPACRRGEVSHGAGIPGLPGFLDARAILNGKPGG